jgi:hypothetical protein
VGVSVPLPTHFKSCRVEEVKDGKLLPVKAIFKSGKITMTLDVVDTARAFVISAQ